MEAFRKLTATAAPIQIANIDTDQIIPARFLKTPRSTDHGQFLFHDMRRGRDGNLSEDFILNQKEFKASGILVADNNFGCGSSREHAPWALSDFGIKVVVSTSFADIFFNNCFKNGMLPIILPEEQVEILMNDSEKGSNARVEVDLEAQTITSSDGNVFSFEVDPFKKHCLLNGLDDIGLTMEKSSSIEAFERKLEIEQPWL